MFFKSSFDYSSGNMAVACTIRRNKRSFYRRVHVDKLATPHSLDLMNVISCLYGARDDDDIMCWCVGENLIKFCGKRICIIQTTLYYR